MHRSKKADMAIPILIGAVLALVILIVLSSMFVSKTKIFSSNLESCQAKFGTCGQLSDCQDAGGSVITGTSCEKDKNQPNKVCCVKPILSQNQAQ